MNSVVRNFCLHCLGRQLYRAGFNPVRRVAIKCRVCGGGSSMNEAISENLAPAGVSRATRQGTTVVQSHPASFLANDKGETQT